jgi:hypothetical protein
MIVEFDRAREVRFGWLGGRVNNRRVCRVTGRDGRRPAGRKGEFNRIKESGGAWLSLDAVVTSLDRNRRD